METGQYSKFKIRSLLRFNNTDFFFISNPYESNKDIKEKLCADLNELTKKSWGDFGQDFINDHVLKSKFLVFAIRGGATIGYASLSEKVIQNNKFYYFEFLVVDPDYQNIGLSKKIITILLKKIFLKQLLSGKINFNLITITPNPKIVGMIYRRSSWMYPNPKDFDGTAMKLPDSKTWAIASNILANSYNPNRILEKEALVLNGSYDSTPWLIYRPNKVPQDIDDRINILCKHYLKL
jgi:RimJ/RimL family protein N-acetyltransferase